MGFLDHRDQCLLAGPAGLQKEREVAALAQLRDTQIDRAGPGLQYEFKPWGKLPAVAEMPDGDRDLVMLGRRV